MSELVKIVVTVPQADANNLRKAIGEAGAGKAGNYSYCSYSVLGTGRFTPEAGADPAIGEVGKPEAVAEERIEVTCLKTQVSAVVAAIRAAHSYEELAIDVYPLIDIA